MSKIFNKFKFENCYLNFDCSIILNDRNFMQRHLNKIIMMHKLVSLLSMKEVNEKMLRTFKYVIICLYLNVVDFKRQLIIARLIAKIHLIDVLTTNLLLIINVLIF